MRRWRLATSRTSTTTHALRVRAVNLTLPALVLLGIALGAPAGADPGNDNRAPVLVGDCQRLQVEPGNKVAFHAFGVGVQIYQWNGTSWDFVAPEATLFADAGNHGVVGVHFGGPTWQSNSGSRVVGAALEQCTPDPTAIPWVLLRAAFHEGPGIFDQVTFIQRVNTVGGRAPSAPGDFAGQVANVPYSADYIFYRKHP